MTDLLDRLKTALADRYAIERELGSGGMAVVFLAHDQKLDRPVALKVLRPELAASVGAERFLREIELAAKLTHPNILALHDCGEVDGLLYYVMPYVEGESLRDRLNREKQLPLDDALRIAREVADALGSAHRHDVIHRDIKPENILLEEGHAVVADFGIARAISEAGGDKLTGTGLAIGTPQYMSPEQAAGGLDLDARTDIYSLGSVLYEMLGGEPPFSGPTPLAILARKSVEPVPSLRLVRDTVPDTVERVIMQSLASATGDRYTTATELAGALDRAYTEAVAQAVVPATGWRHLLRSRAGLALVVILLGALTASTWVFVRSARARWASDEALPEIQRLIDQREIVAAYRLAREAEPFVARNPEFQRLWVESTVPVSIRTTPAGARLYITDYRGTEDDWYFLGISPIEEARIPAQAFRFRVEKAGFQTIEAAFLVTSFDIEFELQPENERPEMIRVPGRPFQFRSPSVRLEPYWLDRYEVTNQAFEEFVDRSGYRERKFWTHPIVIDGRVVPWEQAVTAFMDRTGRPGPSTWQLGTHPDGADDLPVSGVSWYEAAAYCEYAGKQLPTFYHWYNAAGVRTSLSDILVVSNFALGSFSRGEPAPVGTYRGISPYGHYDMAGNVREWVLNPVRDRRYILGGAWSDPGLMFAEPDAALPEDRSPKNGFRCASYAAESTEILDAELEVAAREYERKPVDDAVFRLYRDLYSYDPTPLNPKVESVDEGSTHWRRETITFDAPYGDDRVIAHLFLPKGGNPPYQAVVHYPPGVAFRLQSSRDLHTKWFDFIVRTGRAVLYPVYEGTYERHAARGLLRERVIHWTIDISRSIDYLETRGDIDATKLAYYGFANGGWLGPIFTAIETRFKASVFLGGGLFWEEFPPEIEPTNFAPRATVPVLMVNGRDDFESPLEAAQLPLFRLLGAPDHDKRHALVEGGLVPDDMQAVVKEILDWLDRYLGPVRQRNSP
jgi:formylglycine-generating enzyme required for sulfatase activity